jgi:plastocyanin
VTVDPAACGERIPDESLLVDAQGGVQNAVVVLRPTSTPAAAPVPDAAAVVDNAGCRFVPRVQVVRRGQTVRVHNADSVLHNARADLVGPPDVPVANLALSRAGITMDLTRRLTARLPENPPETVVRLGCDVHSWMRGWLVVIDQGVGAITDASGRYTLPDIPAGRYMLSIWHEQLGRRERQLEVPKSGTLVADEKF